MSDENDKLADDSLNGIAQVSAEGYAVPLTDSTTPELLSASDFYHSLLKQKQWDDTPADWALDFGEFGSVEKRIWRQWSWSS